MNRLRAVAATGPGVELLGVLGARVSSVCPERRGTRVVLAILFALAGVAGCGSGRLPADPTLEHPILGTHRKSCVLVIGVYDERQFKVLLAGEHNAERWVPIDRREIALDGCKHPRITPATLTAPPQVSPSAPKQKEQVRR